MKLDKLEIALEVAAHTPLPRNPPLSRIRKAPKALVQEQILEPTKTLLEVGRQECRYPYPKLMVCGRPSGKKTYCPEHASFLLVPNKKGPVKT